jgi:type VI secretion system protein ImpA
VLRALDAIMGYYRAAEPSSPVPVLLQRARRLVGADFMAIMRDMAPNGLDNVRLIGGLGDDE